jgi:hypothetical protein
MLKVAMTASLTILNPSGTFEFLNDLLHLHDLPTVAGQSIINGKPVHIRLPRFGGSDSLISVS